MGLVTASMFIHAALTIAMHVDLRKMSEESKRTQHHAKMAASFCESASQGIISCNIAVDRLSNSVDELAGEINENVFRLMWQQDAHGGRRNR